MLRFFIILLFSFIVKASEHSFRLPIEFKDFITPLIDMDSKKTEDVSLLFTPDGGSNFDKRLDMVMKNKFIEKFLFLNNIDRTDTYEEFSVRKKTDAFKELNDQAYFKDNFFFEKNREPWSYPCNMPVFELLKELENPEDIFLLFSQNTAFVLFLSSLSSAFHTVMFFCLMHLRDDKDKEKFAHKSFLEAVNELSQIHEYGLNKETFIRIHNFQKMMIERIEYVDDVQQEPKC
ncbi:MAG: hypothetical protein HEEMFOPI_01295 [Holosporales bacterium]